MIRSRSTKASQASLDEREKQQYNAYMEEYKALRGEITAYSQRISLLCSVWSGSFFDRTVSFLSPLIWIFCAPVRHCLASCYSWQY